MDVKLEDGYSKVMVNGTSIKCKVGLGIEGSLNEVNDKIKEVACLGKKRERKNSYSLC